MKKVCLLKKGEPAMNRRTRRYLEKERLARGRWIDEGDVRSSFAAEIETPPLLWETISEMKEALEQTIADAEMAQTEVYGAFDGQLVATTAGHHTYQFKLKTYWDVQENAKVYVIDNQNQKRDARVVSRVAMTILIVVREVLPEESLARVTLIEDTAWLLRRQLQAVTTLQETVGQFGAKTLGLLPVQSGVTAVRGKLGTFEPNQAQLRAIGHGLASERALIIGPGGTGKTATMSDLICPYLRQGLSVLLVSHTNIATDNAFIPLIKAMLGSRKADLRSLVEQGLVVRQGDPRHVALLKGEYRGLTVTALAEARTGEQAQVRERLQKESEELGHKVEELERDLQQREQAWQMRRDELLQKITPLAEQLKSLRAEREEGERKERAFFELKARQRVEVLKILEPLRSQHQQLLEARKQWAAEQQRRKQNWESARDELRQVREMGSVKRFFSEYRDYDFDAAEQNVIHLLREKERAEDQIVTIDNSLHENEQARREPEAALSKIDFEEQGIRNLKASSVADMASVQIQRLEQRLALLQEKLDKGEAPIVLLRAVYASIELCDRIDTRNGATSIFRQAQ
jgi:AAA domain